MNSSSKVSNKFIVLPQYPSLSKKAGNNKFNIIYHGMLYKNLTSQSLLLRYHQKSTQACPDLHLVRLNYSLYLLKNCMQVQVLPPYWNVRFYYTWPHEHIKFSTHDTRILQLQLYSLTFKVYPFFSNHASGLMYCLTS